MATRPSQANQWMFWGSLVVVFVLLGALSYYLWGDDLRRVLAFPSMEETEEEQFMEDEEESVLDDEEDEDEEESPVIQSVPFTTLAKGFTGGQENRATFAITSDTELDAALRAMDNPIDLGVDFENHIVLAAFAGMEPTGGHDITISHIREEAGMLIVTVVKTDPGSSCVVTQALTSPYHIVLLRTQQADVSFRMEYETKEC